MLVIYFSQVLTGYYSQVAQCIKLFVNDCYSMCKKLNTVQYLLEALMSAKCTDIDGTFSVYSAVLSWALYKYTG